MTASLFGTTRASPSNFTPSSSDQDFLNFVSLGSLEILVLNLVRERKDIEIPLSDSAAAVSRDSVQLQTRRFTAAVCLRSHLPSTHSTRVLHFITTPLPQLFLINLSCMRTFTPFF